MEAVGMYEWRKLACHIANNSRSCIRNREQEQERARSITLIFFVYNGYALFIGE